ncbi:MAG: NAD(P)/FAD-dependent oxidoreductase [Candidatus Gastranaerophilales bacterium]|nr:NAD(P)/FAD-dependent oxidoreductase [Candidatus Gastranaerophilales bacterium]
MKKIAVIGGGPAGFMAAISAKENAKNPVIIDIYEKENPLKTILYTGGGRCNFSNEIYDFKELAKFYPRGEKFLYSVFSRFGVKETLEWFSVKGLRYYTQDDNRIFPKSNLAKEVRDLLLKTSKDLNINIFSNVKVEKITLQNNGFLLYQKNQISKYDAVIIATGGFLKRDSSGYNCAKSLGHKISELKPSLTGLIIQDFDENIAGISIQNASVEIFFQNKKINDFKGDFIYTHKGISGPIAHKISSFGAFLKFSKENPLILNINFVQKNLDEIDKILQKDLENSPKKSILNIISSYIPKNLANFLLTKNNIDIEKKSSYISKQERKIIANMLINARLKVISTDDKGEIVTAGGVELKEINSKTMESKLCKNLYFCGEVLNIDGLTGGFNLQMCWSTGYIAGLFAS